MRAAYNGHTDRVRAFRLWGRGDVDGRWVTALLLYRYWCPSPPMSSGNKKTGDPPGSRGLRGPGAAPLPAQLRAFHGHSGVALHWHDHSRPTEPASGAWWVRGWGMWVLPLWVSDSGAGCLWPTRFDASMIGIRKNRVHSYITDIPS
jgi:hypothetical protein